MKEDLKQLLFKDLSARLPYGVYIGDKYGNKWKLVGIETYANTVIFKQTDDNLGITAIEEIKPYLRLLSSMTDKEKQYIRNKWCYTDWDDIIDFFNRYQIYASDSYDLIDWLYKHHFDCAGLICKDLALEATNDMYNLND